MARSLIDHSRHASVKNFMVNVLAGLIAYTFQEKKPSLKLDKNEVEKLGSISLLKVHNLSALAMR